MTTQDQTRRVRWSRDRDVLRREVTFGSGKAGYTHRCPLADFEAVAEAFTDGEPHTLHGLRDQLGLAWNRMDVAVEFMIDRGCLKRGPARRNEAATPAVYEDALCEFHVLPQNEKWQGMMPG